MRIVVFSIKEVNVVRGDYSDIQLLRNLDYALCDYLLTVVYSLRCTVHHRPHLGLVLHHLKREIVAEKVLVPFRDALRLVHASAVYRLCDLARKTR